MALQGVCKDCGNGTLNNDLNRAFGGYETDADLENQDIGFYCLRCGSEHVDLVA